MRNYFIAKKILLLLKYQKITGRNLLAACDYYVFLFLFSIMAQTLAFKLRDKIIQHKELSSTLLFLLQLHKSIRISASCLNTLHLPFTLNTCLRYASFPSDSLLCCCTSSHTFTFPAACVEEETHRDQTGNKLSEV